MTRYRNRRDAGRALAEALRHLTGTDPLVLGIPRGGIVVAAEVARALGTTLAPLAAVKIRPSPGSEFAIGAVTPDGHPRLDAAAVRMLGMSEAALTAAVRDAVEEVTRRQEAYGPVPAIGPESVVIVVDDGVATGATLRAALDQVRRSHPGRLVCAVPVAAPDTAAALAAEVDELVCPLRPAAFHAVGEFYVEFGQTTDAEVIALLQGGNVS